MPPRLSRRQDSSTRSSRGTGPPELGPGGRIAAAAPCSSGTQTVAISSGTDGSFLTPASRPVPGLAAQNVLFGQAEASHVTNGTPRQIGGTVRVLLNPLVTPRDAEIVAWTF